MKTNFYILLILLLSFSYGDAQGRTEIEENGANKVVVTNVNDNVTIVTDYNPVKTENKALLIDEDELKESIARTSDIRQYLNHVRNVQNIKLLFPKINKAVKA
ncbi:hypothetical protein [Flavivirga eckloniae]|uniref:Uncharacterized protein n=1 Tax=Flavivirga eckloniae TaxID=1803846 RepID=A0A2K9PVH0_9FLAO|nr:hypothetical protein [Flavivirga eckloniae]AUP81072.1 hypothetical protein C1H87_21090 [Flavivirga eckloniae]